MAADHSPIPCWGTCTFTMYAGGCTFNWTFLLAAVAFLIIGADFLAKFDLMVDIKGLRLRHGTQDWYLPFSTPPSPSVFAAIGVRPTTSDGVSSPHVPPPADSPGGQRRSTPSARTAAQNSDPISPDLGWSLNVPPVDSPGGQRRSTPWDVTPYPSLA